jgi:hypothetical protein
MGALQIGFGLYATVLPFALFVAWVALALHDLAARDDLTGPARLGWSVGVVVLPLVGAAGYLVAASRIRRAVVIAIVGGGVVGYLVVLAVTMAVGGTA